MSASRNWYAAWQLKRQRRKLRSGHSYAVKRQTEPTTEGRARIAFQSRKAAGYGCQLVRVVVICGIPMAEVLESHNWLQGPIHESRK